MFVPVALTFPPALRRIEPASVPTVPKAVTAMSSPAFKTVSLIVCVTEPEASRLISVPAFKIAPSVISPLFAVKSIFSCAVRFWSIFNAFAESRRIYPPAVKSS